MPETQHSFYLTGCQENSMYEYVSSMYEAYFRKYDFRRPTFKEFMEMDWKESGQKGESPQAWMEKPDPDFEDFRTKYQLASFRSRVEDLLTHSISLPNFMPPAQQNLSPTNRGIPLDRRSFIPPRESFFDSPSRNRAQPNWRSLAPPPKVPQPERHRVNLSPPKEKPSDVRQTFRQPFKSANDFSF